VKNTSYNDQVQEYLKEYSSYGTHYKELYMSVNEKQVAGDHYKKYGNLQPWDVVVEWKLGYLEGTALKYIARWRDKNGVEDIKKAIHFLEKLVEVEEAKNDSKLRK
jgi:hypothetical protein